ncbi:MAG TPA: hypothetical protein VN577_00275 [Terriglobales bacterium]|nr:hypothetical protein [Terriglobales bacterium]
MRKRFFAALACLLFIVGSSFAQQFKVGVTDRQFVPPGDYNWRGAKAKVILTTIWYPAPASANEVARWIGDPSNPMASAPNAAPDAPLASAPSKFPLILVSHGTGGTSGMMAWLGARLAKHGYIVVGVNHPGNNGITGYTVEGFTLWWERARDLSSVLDLVLKDQQFASRIDANRIGAAGFSLGGYTMIEIAGGITDPDRFLKLCETTNDNAMCVDPPEFPNLKPKAEKLLETDPVFKRSFESGSASFRDHRIRAVFAIAPALAVAFKPESLHKISIPVQIVSGAADPIVPVTSNAEVFAKAIPGAKLKLIPKAVHYTYLGTCTDSGRKAEPGLCVDPPGVNRDSVHQQTADLALQFFRVNLK